MFLKPRILLGIYSKNARTTNSFDARYGFAFAEDGGYISSMASGRGFEPPSLNEDGSSKVLDAVQVSTQDSGAKGLIAQFSENPYFTAVSVQCFTAALLMLDRVSA